MTQNAERFQDQANSQASHTAPPLEHCSTQVKGCYSSGEGVVGLLCGPKFQGRLLLISKAYPAVVDEFYSRDVPHNVS